MAPDEQIWTVEKVFQLIMGREDRAIAFARRRCGSQDAEEAYDESINIMVAKVMGGQYTIASEGKAWKLFLLVLRTQARNCRNRAKRLGSWSFDEDRDDRDESCDPARRLQVLEGLQQIRECIEALDLNQKVVFLRRLNRERVEDIASDLGISISTVSRLYHRTENSIRTQLEASE